jgi:hypothetical protein
VGKPHPLADFQFFFQRVKDKSHPLAEKFLKISAFLVARPTK